MTAAVEVQHLTVRYGSNLALQKLDLRVPAGTALGIIGANGSGKSTLLKSVAGLLRPSSGSVMVFGRLPKKNPAGTVAYVPQIELVDWKFPATVRDVVAMGRFSRLPFYRRFGQDDAQKVQAALEALDMLALSGRHISALSGGQQQRAFLARALAQDPDILLLDEPTTGVDAKTAEVLRQAVRRFVSEGRTVLMSTHDLDEMNLWFDRVIIVERRLIADGTPDEIDAAGHRLIKEHGHGHARSGGHV